MTKKILIVLSVIILIIFSSGCNSSSVMNDKSGRTGHMTLAESIESYILSNECGLLNGSEKVCFAGILTLSQDDHNKCNDIICEKEDI